jgi:hypothetical protein
MAVAHIPIIVETRTIWWRFWLLRACWSILEVLGVFAPEARDFLFRCGLSALKRLKPFQYRLGGSCWRPAVVKDAR